MVELPHTSLVLIKKKWYVNCTIPKDLRPLFKDRKQIRRSTGTADKSRAERLKHSISSEIYEELAKAKPDRTNAIFESLCKLGVVPEDIEGFTSPDELTEDDLKTMEILAEAPRHPEPALPEEMAMEASGIERGRVAAHEAIQELRRLVTPKPSHSGSVVLSVTQREYLDSKPYGPAKTIRDAELSIGEFQAFAGDIPLSDVTAVMIHSYAEKLGGTKSRETIAKKIGYVKRMYDWAVRKGYVEANVFMTITLDKKLGTARASYQPFSHDELTKIFGLEMPEHLKTLLSILVTTGTSGRMWCGGCRAWPTSDALTNAILQPV
ncbi:DUF6538 domain-containing protein [Tateyamaria sp. Alg231-49]|uniref:DUF6538 domain-containing protein n=1 Tax=Tateyamaria sp. Alg231-49 TaxID=1922219 RepID=UPI0027951F38|nr:DUF6538 domain-containing protein [Tateyamaria sp. Alg231-49]